MELIEVNKFCGSANQAGLTLIEYAPIDNVDPASFVPIISATYNWQQDISFFSGSWLKFPILAKDDSWQENQKEQKAGTFYEQLFSGLTPNMRPEVNGEFQKMAKHRFILRLKDQNQQTWLIGTLDNPLRFSAKATTGNRKGFNQYQIRFQGVTKQRAFGFSPVL
jgi:hypothetical protein